MDVSQRYELGEQIRLQMHAKRMTREQMQEALTKRDEPIHVDVKTISNITTGRTAGRPETLRAIADLLGIDVPKEYDTTPNGPNGDQIEVELGSMRVQDRDRNIEIEHVFVRGPARDPDAVAAQVSSLIKSFATSVGLNAEPEVD